MAVTGRSGTLTYSGTKNMTCRIGWAETYDPDSNTSWVSIQSLALMSTNYYGYTYYLDGTIKVNGTTVITFSSTIGGQMVTVNNTNTYYNLTTADGFDAVPWGNVVVSHASDGTGSCPIEINISGYTVNGNGANGFNCSGTQTVTLTTIDQAAPAISVTVSNITATGFQINISASAICDRWYVSDDGGATYSLASSVSATSRTVIASDYDPATTYRIKIKARKKSNGVYGYSGTVRISTLGASLVYTSSAVYPDASNAVLKMDAVVYDSSYEHILQLCYGDDVLLQIEGLYWDEGDMTRTISLTETQRQTLLNAMSTCKTLTAEYRLWTFNGSSLVGEYDSVSVTLYTSASRSGPTMEGFTYYDGRTAVSNITGNNQLLVQGCSYLYVTPGVATARNGASIVQYSVSCSGKYVTTKTHGRLSVGTINAEGDVQVVVTATDSRGYTATQTQTLSVLPYARPKVSDLSLRRTNGIEAEMALVFNGSISSILIDGVEKNGLSEVRYRYRATNESSYRNFVSILGDTTVNGTSFSYENLELCSLDANTSFEVHIQILDALNSYSATNLYYIIAPGTPLVALRKKMVGINTPTPDAALHVVGNTHLEGGTTINGDTRIVGKLTPDELEYDFDVDAMYYGTCSTSYSTAAKTVTCSDFVLKTGATIAIRFTYYNSAASPTLNVNGTGAYSIMACATTAPEIYYWRSKQVVLFCFDGSYWQIVGTGLATTTYYGVTKLTNSISSESTTTAATPYSVKQAYDRQDFNTITLYNPLAVAYGGTGASTEVSARSNLGIKATALYSGTLSSGSTSFNFGSYKAYIIIGKPGANTGLSAIVIPAAAITTTKTKYQLADETYFVTFNLYYSGSYCYLAYNSGSGSITKVYGIN